MKCRFCNTPLSHTFVDLGMSPLANAYLTRGELQNSETFYPLRAQVCEHCYLVQLPDAESPEVIFDDEYAYFSSYSESWLRHCEAYVKDMTERFTLNADSQVVEVASNDGYLLQYFVERGIPVLGIEPAASVANEAISSGIPTLKKFFGEEVARQLAEEGTKADLLIGNNVLAHVPNINSFVGGLKTILRPDGVITMEFPHLLKLIENREFDTIYHEHYSYFSLQSVSRIFEHHGIPLFDVEEIPTHGGSLRIYAHHAEDTTHNVTPRVEELLDYEKEHGLTDLSTYTEFSTEVEAVKREVLRFLIEAKEEGKSVVGYGAAAKGNTLLNYCGIRTDLLDYVVDRNPHKQNKFLPGTHIPILAPEKIFETRPDYIVILPWNLKEEVMHQMKEVCSWGGAFVTFIPTVAVHENVSTPAAAIV